MDVTSQLLTGYRESEFSEGHPHGADVLGEGGDRHRSAQPDTDGSMTLHDDGQPSLMESGGRAGAPATFLVAEREHRLYILTPAKIDYIESDGNYVLFHVDHAEYISRDSIKRLSHLLAGSGFLRIARSILINLRSIAYAERMGRGTYAFTLAGGSTILSGVTYRTQILRVLPLQTNNGRKSQ